MPRSLLDLNVGEKGRIIQLTDPEVAKSMMCMGILPLRDIELVRMDPFGSNLYVKTENLTIALRQSEAANIIIA